jgi:hypothetical protein
MKAKKASGSSPIRNVVRSKFPKSRIVEEHEPTPFQADSSPLAPDRITPETKRLYEKFFGLSASPSMRADGARTPPSDPSEDEHPLSDQEGGVLIEKPGRRQIKEQVLVSGGKIVAFSD